MRTTRELLMLMRDNIDLISIDRCQGLCVLTTALYLADVFTPDEYFHIESFIHDNRPVDADPVSRWWYDMGDRAPRHKWLNEQIENLNNREDEKRRVNNRQAT